MPNELPQRDPFVGPLPAEFLDWWRKPPVDTVELFAGAMRVWASQAAPPESDRCRTNPPIAEAERNTAGSEL